MTARLLVREVGQREFTAHNGDYEATAEDSGLLIPARTDVENAEAEGLRLCLDGNVEAFQVWTLHCAKERHWALREIEQ